MRDLLISTSTLLVIIALVIILVVIANKLGKLNRKQILAWRIIHFTGIIILFSGLLGTLLLTVNASTSLTRIEQVQTAHHLARLFDWYFIVPGAFISLLSGIWLSVRSQWGLTNYHWTMVKTLGTIGCILFGSTWMRIWFEQTILLSSTGLLNNPVYIHNRQMLLLGTVVSLAMLFFLVIVSYLKPWGKRRYSLGGQESE
ncbi:hypothetical protein ASZ90_019307 [hydrocarbon metagenome]|uniref:Integral membrane protein n=1 Tax=hydrocarbon metagenome TaxID=938273 RepID=A0A0W8E3G1_9ZZZZ